MEKNKNIKILSTVTTTLAIAAPIMALLLLLLSTAGLGLKTSRLDLKYKPPAQLGSQFEDLRIKLDIIEMQTKTLSIVPEESAIA